MAGGLINIVSYGAQDLFLTGLPQITYFKVVYRRYINFSIESYILQFDNSTGFNTESQLSLPLLGDLVNKMYLRIKISPMKFLRSINEVVLNDLKCQYEIAKSELIKISTFMKTNINAYRAAIEVYCAENVINSCDMSEVIIKIFESYTNCTNKNAEAINFFYDYSPLPNVPVFSYNLLCIAQKYDKNPISKLEFKQIIDNAVINSKYIQQFYETKLRDIECAICEESNCNRKFAWVDRLGHAIIDYIDVSICGQRIDRMYGDWLNIWYELNSSIHLEEIYMKMIGNVPEMTCFNRIPKPEYYIYVPLQFWFNKLNGLALPLIALQNTEVTIDVKLKKFKDCAYLENIGIPENIDNYIKCQCPLEVSLLVDYVYLDTIERKRFAQSSHEYLIEQVQWIDVCDVEKSEVKINLDFNNPCRELIWRIQKQAFITNINGSTKCRWDNYSFTKFNKGLSINSAAIDFSGESLVARFCGSYFNYVQPYSHHTRTPSDGINVYSFSLRPEEYQPSGSCNMSRISKAVLSLWIDPRMFMYYPSDINDCCIPCPNEEPLPTAVNIRVYALSFNILRFVGGLAGLAFV